MALIRTLGITAIAPVYLAFSLVSGTEPAAVDSAELSMRRSAPAVDTLRAAALGSAGIVLSVVPAGGAGAVVRPGERWSAPVVLDLGAGETGDLGAIELELRYDPAVLRFDVVTSSLQHAITAHHLVEPGRIRFAAAVTEPQETVVVELMEAHFTVRADATTNAPTSLEVVIPRRPLSTARVPYDLPAAAGASVLVVQ